MINEQLVALSRAITAVVRGTECDAAEMRKLFLAVVPELLAEIEILGNIAGSVLPEPEEEAASEEKMSRSARRRRKRRSKR
jgi:Mn-containing catalase